MTDRSFSIIGAGNLGTRLALALATAGYRLQSIYKKAKYSTPLLDNVIETDIVRLVAGSGMIFITTQESRIAGAVSDLAETGGLQGKYIYHTSNSLTSGELLPLKTKGAYVASFSPLQTFADVSSVEQLTGELFKGVYFLAEGDVEAVALAKEMGQRLGANVLEVAGEDKPYIHIAAVSAANFLIAVLTLAERQLQKTGKSGIEILLPLIRQTLANVENQGVEASLTGPAKRKETGIIEKHLSLLEGSDKALYKALTDYLMKSNG